MTCSRFFATASTLSLALTLNAPLAFAQTAPAAPSAKPQQPPQSGPITVTGIRRDVTTTADRVSFSVANDLQVRTGTLADALRSVPGVDVDVNGQVSLRGDSSVKILIDGRPSAMLQGEGRDTAVLTMPSGQIERVEVITNPSAAMSPEGGGVINLVMKKSRPNTRSATIKANVGGRGRQTVGLNATTSGSKLTATVDANYRRFNGDNQLTQRGTFTDPATGAETVVDRVNDLDFSTNGGTLRASIDYDADKSDRLSTEGNYFSFDNALRGDERVESSGSGVLGSYARIGDTDVSVHGKSGKLSWRHTFPGREHELVSEAEIGDGGFRRSVDAVTVPDIGSPMSERFANDNRWKQKSVKVEYKRPFGADTLNVGYNGDFNRYDFNSRGARGPTFDNLTELAAFTNRFGYDETIHAGFATYDFTVGKLESDVGLRVEQVLLDIEQFTDGSRFENDYLRFYPTLHLSYAVDDSDSLRASYSRRIQRPQSQDLNPYLLYIDPLNQRQGNPLLKPETTDSVELGWQHRKKSAFYSLTAFYRNSKDGVTDVFSLLGDGVVLTTRANLAKARRVGAEAIANGKLTKTLTYNASASYYWNQIDPNVGALSRSRSGTTGTVRGSMNWQPTAKDFFQLSANYSGRQLLPQGYRNGGGLINLGYRRKVNDKFSLVATAQDVFATQKQTTFFETPNGEQRTTQRGVGRILMAGLTYTFGAQRATKGKEGFDFQQPAGGDSAG
ncbi:MAG: TonB-dependent receptor [Sphingomicrobium sp.]